MVCLTIIHGADPFLSEIRHTQQKQPLIAALPFKDDKKSLRYETLNENDEEAEHDNEEEFNQVEDNGALRISTRARLNYNLESYSKNAMLVFNANPETVKENDRIPERVAAIIETFSKFRFEIETHLELTRGQIDAKCEEFFQRDFSEYGCVAVVVLSLESTHSAASGILRHGTVSGNPTLQNKPKLYIDECNLRKSYREFNNKRSPITVDYPDVLWLYLPARYFIDARQPFQIFCDKLADMADYDDMMTIIKVAINETKPLFRYNIYIASTLEKMMFLARSDAEITRL